MKLSFITPLFNGLALTQAMLASLRSTLPPGLEYEIILIDDGSTDGTREWLASLAAPCRTLTNPINLGFAATCNRGAAAATGSRLYFLNNDLELLPGWLEPMQDAFSKLPQVGLVGNVQLRHATGEVDHAGIAFSPKGKPVHLTQRGWSAVRHCDAVTGACFAIERALWTRLGGFDESYVNGGEDVDLALRARESGHPSLVALRSVVRHHVSASTGRKLRDEQNTRLLFRRWQAHIAARISRHCARDCLLASWEEPRDYPDPALVRDAVWHWLGLQTRPAPRLHQAALARLAYEEARWAHVLDGAPRREERTTCWQFYPSIPENPAVI